MKKLKNNHCVVCGVKNNKRYNQKGPYTCPVCKETMEYLIKGKQNER